MKHLIALRNGQFYIQPGQASNPQLALSVQAELMKYGFMLDQEGLEKLQSSDEATTIEAYEAVTAYLKELLGADRHYTPLWKNFPADVLAASECELYMSAIIHYLSNGTWEPSTHQLPRTIAFEQTTFKVLRAVSGDDWLRKLAFDLAGFPKPLDARRREDLVWIAKNISDVAVPQITVKETLVALAVAGLSVPITTPTDVLRIAHAVSGGDASLPKIPAPRNAKLDVRRPWLAASRAEELEADYEKFKFAKFNRAQRRYLLGLIEGCYGTADELASEMQQKLERWKRLGELLHPGEFLKLFPKTHAAFALIRNQHQGNKVRTFAGQVDMAFAVNLREGLSALARRPGEFARRLDSLLRKYDSGIVLDAFAQVADRVSGKVIFEMYDHFEGRRKAAPRMVMLKGSGSKAKVLEQLEALPSKVVDDVQHMVETIMKARWAKLPKLGKVYVDKGLKLMPVPFSMQSSSEGLSTLARGTRTQYSDSAKILRAFVHWFDKNGMIDIDLAALFLKPNFAEVGHVTFYELRNELGYHSGDVRHRVGDSAEYIDVDLEACRAKDVRYVAFYVYNYNGTSLEAISPLFGVMERSAPKSNEIFDPKTVTTSAKIAVKSQCSSPVVFDLLLKQWIWVDIEREQRGLAHLASDTAALDQLKSIIGGSKLTIYDLVIMHATARGATFVGSPTQADVQVLASDIRSNYAALAQWMPV